MVPCDPRSLQAVREAIREGVERSGFPVHFLNRLQVAVDEAVTNVIAHGFAGQTQAELSIDLAVDSGCFRIEVEDEGPAFDPHSVPDPDPVQLARRGQAGGLGLFLIRRIMDGVDYRYEGGCRNHLTLTKYATPR